MNTQDDTPAANPPRRIGINFKTGCIVALAAVILAIIINSILPPRWHPTLEVKNTGTNAVTLSFKGGTFTCQPGQTWRNSYGGDTLTIRASEAADAGRCSLVQRLHSVPRNHSEDFPCFACPLFSQT